MNRQFAFIVLFLFVLFRILQIELLKVYSLPAALFLLICENLSIFINNLTENYFCIFQVSMETFLGNSVSGTLKIRIELN